MTITPEQRGLLRRLNIGYTRVMLDLDEQAALLALIVELGGAKDEAEFTWNHRSCNQFHGRDDLICRDPCHSFKPADWQAAWRTREIESYEFAPNGSIP